MISKTGHAFIKAKMRAENAAYGGEMSAHHYFRDFAYCDSGMIPWLLVAQLLSVSGHTLKSLVEKRMEAFPCSGEINFRVENSAAVLAAIYDKYHSDAQSVLELDGLSMDMGEWRFNVRTSNTEPLMRLNIETRSNIKLMIDKTEEMSSMIKSFSYDV